MPGYVLNMWDEEEAARLQLDRYRELLHASWLRWQREAGLSDDALYLAIGQEHRRRSKRADLQPADADSPAELALRNVRMMASRLRRRAEKAGDARLAEDAGHLLRFCAEAGIVASPLRADPHPEATDEQG